MTLPQLILLRMRNISGKAAQKIKIHFMFNKVFFPQNSAVYDGKILYIRTDHR
jgi:hypothetical protein